MSDLTRPGSATIKREKKLEFAVGRSLRFVHGFIPPCSRRRAGANNSGASIHRTGTYRSWSPTNVHRAFIDFSTDPESVLLRWNSLRGKLSFGTGPRARIFIYTRIHFYMYTICAYVHMPFFSAVRLRNARNENTHRHARKLHR